MFVISINDFPHEVVDTTDEEVVKRRKHELQTLFDADAAARRKQGSMERNRYVHYQQVPFISALSPHDIALALEALRMARMAQENMNTPGPAPTQGQIDNDLCQRFNT